MVCCKRHGAPRQACVEGVRRGRGIGKSGFNLITLLQVQLLSQRFKTIATVKWKLVRRDSLRRAKEKQRKTMGKCGKPTKQHSSQDRTHLLHDVIQFGKQQNTPNKDMMTINENYAHNISSK